MFQHFRFVVQVLEFSSKHIGNDGMPPVNGSFDKEYCHLLAVCLTRSTFNRNIIFRTIYERMYHRNTYIISGFPAAIAQVAGPSLAPRFKKTCTT